MTPTLEEKKERLPHEGYNECPSAFIGESRNQFVQTFNCKCPLKD